jgi:hypothetical protein
MGQVRCAEKWGILNDEMMSGRMNMIYWAGETHWGIYPVWAYAGRHTPLTLRFQC